MDYFSNFGKVINGVVMLGKNGKSRQFGFVTFTSADAVKDCLNYRHHFLHGQEFHVEVSTSPNCREPVPTRRRKKNKRKISLSDRAFQTQWPEGEKKKTKLR